MATVDPVLTRFRAALDRVYGDRVERVVLFGSRARGDARPDSDYDVAVFLKDLTDRWDEVDRIADIAADIMDETGAFVHAMPYRAGTYRDRTPLMHEVRGEGRDFCRPKSSAIATRDGTGIHSPAGTRRRSRRKRRAIRGIHRGIM